RVPSHPRSIACHLSLAFCRPRDRSRSLHSFPTRRSSDLALQNQHAISFAARLHDPGDGRYHPSHADLEGVAGRLHTKPCRQPEIDRKSTRLNSSHVKISYAVFCLKKKSRVSASRYPFTTG